MEKKEYEKVLSSLICPNCSLSGKRVRLKIISLPLVIFRGNECLIVVPGKAQCSVCKDTYSFTHTFHCSKCEHLEVLPTLRCPKCGSKIKPQFNISLANEKNYTYNYCECSKATCLIITSDTNQINCPLTPGKPIGWHK